jgi:molybdopterin converting factor small subunit
VSAIRIPPVLRVSTGGAKHVEIPGATVREVLDALVLAYPGLASQLLTAEGQLSTFVNVFVNDTDIRHLDALETPIGERDSLVLLPAMAGGRD